MQTCSDVPIAVHGDRSTIRINSGQGPYADSIRRFFVESWPHTFETKEGDVAEMVLNAILASGRIRLGPRPGIESMNMLLTQVKGAIEANEPVNIVIPWGARKPVSREIVDLAEVAALRTLQNLSERVKAVYQYGIVAYMRVEDASVAYLYEDTGIDGLQDSEIYADSFYKLVDVLGLEWVEWRNERLTVTPGLFKDQAMRSFHPLLNYIEASEGLSDDLRKLMPEYERLIDLGWQGTIPDEQRDHYRESYQRLYKTDKHMSNVMLARYLAAAKARRDLNVTGGQGLSHFIELAFNEPVPGEPVRGRRIVYRTMPEHVSRIHIAPWRAKGYLAMREDGARVRLASWTDKERRYERITSTLHKTSFAVDGDRSSEDATAEVQTDYEIV